MKNNIIAIDTTKEYSSHVDKVLERSKREIFAWFEKPSYDCKVKVFIYKDISALVEGLKKRGHTNYPEYMCACMIDEEEEKNITRNINIYEPSPNPSEKEYSKKEYDVVIFHEVIHYITDYLFGKLPEWLTEGIAKQLDGSYQKDVTNLLKNYINTYEIPDIHEVKGKNFIKKEGNKIIYDGYDFGYIMVRYLIEVYGKEYLFNLMEQKERLETSAQSILIEAIDYFNKEYNVEKRL